METPAHRYEALCMFTPWDLQVIRETVTELSKSARMHVQAACLTPSGFSLQASQHSGSKDSKLGPSASWEFTGVVVFSRIFSIYVNQLQDQRSPGHDAGPAGQQVPAHQALQHRAFAAALQSQGEMHAAG